MELKYKYIFSLIITTNIIINLDHGIIPAASLQIQESLKINNDELGYLGSLVYLGIVAVGLFGGKIFLNLNAKSVLIASYISMIGTLILFTQQLDVIWPYYVSRFLTGAAQAPMLIYFPVWVDNFGLELKTLWLTMLQGFIPLGIFVGYVLSSVISNIWNWNLCFWVQIIMLIPCLIIFCFIRSADIDIKRSQKDKILKNKTQTHDELNVSILSTNQKSYWQLLRDLIKIKVWVCTTLGISVLYFIVTGIQFWMSNYMITVLKADSVKVNTVFSAVSITAPVLGCIVGGSVTSYIGGYEKRNSLYVCVLYCILSCITASPIPFIDSFWTVTVLIWLVLFFGGAIVPPITGIMLTSVPHKLRAFANSNTTTIYNLLGFLPAPSVYGLMSQYFGERAGLIFLMYYTYFGLLVLLLATYFRSKQRKSKSEEDLAGAVSDADEFNITERVLHFNEIPYNPSITQQYDEHKRDFDIKDEFTTIQEIEEEQNYSLPPS